MSTSWTSYSDARSAAEACAAHVQSVLETALAGGGDATVAFSGGSTPKPMLEALARSPVEWQRVQIYQVDERPVPPEHPESNYKLLFESLLRPARVPGRNIHRIQAELNSQQAARHYEADIRECFALAEGELPHFDIIQLGIGPDAHTASLFPGEPLIEDREQIVGAVRVEKLSQWRITLLPGALLSARNTAVLVAGEDKSEAMHNVMHAPYDPLRFPAQIIANHSRRATWFLDQAAARLLD